MATITRKCRIARHDEYDYVGLQPLWMPDHQADPLQGMGIAHDVLEHGARDLCEFQGLGGAVLVRGIAGYFGNRTRGNPDPVENIASDFQEVYRLWQGQDLPDPGRTRAVDDTDAEEMIQQIVRKGCADICHEAAGWHGDGFPEDIRAAASWTRAEQQQRMIGWMRKGYRAAAGRWRGSVGMIMETFCAIEKAADQLLGEYAHAEGAEVTITFDPETARVRCQLQIDEEY